MSTARTILVALGLALGACEDAEPSPSPFTPPVASPYGGGQEEEEDDADHEACLEIAECVADFCDGSTLGGCAGYEECWGPADDDLANDALKVAKACDLEPSNSCAIYSMECGR